MLEEYVIYSIETFQCSLLLYVYDITGMEIVY